MVASKKSHVNGQRWSFFFHISCQDTQKVSRVFLLSYVNWPLFTYSHVWTLRIFRVSVKLILAVTFPKSTQIQNNFRFFLFPTLGLQSSINLKIPRFSLWASISRGMQKLLLSPTLITSSLLETHGLLWFCYRIEQKLFFVSWLTGDMAWLCAIKDSPQLS